MALTWTRQQLAGSHVCRLAPHAEADGVLVRATADVALLGASAAGLRTLRRTEKGVTWELWLTPTCLFAFEKLRYNPPVILAHRMNLRAVRRYAADSVAQTTQAKKTADW